MSKHPNLDILINYGGIDTNSLLSVTNMFEDDNNEINLIKQSRYFSIDDLISCLNNSHESFNIMSLNIQSINAKFNSFTALIDLINEKIIIQ